MFSVGLEFSLPQLMSMRRTVFGFGGAQVAAVVAARRHGRRDRRASPGARACVVGGVVAMSSTAIISKVLSERMQLHSPTGARSWACCSSRTSR